MSGDKTRITMAVLKRDMEHLKDLLKLGFTDVKDDFKGVHQRQDIANGRLGKNEKKVTHIDSEVDNIKNNFATKEDLVKSEKNQVIKENHGWIGVIKFTIGIAATILGALIIDWIRNNF